MLTYGFEYNVVLAALLIDIVLGDPRIIYRYVPHPVALLGNLIGYLERTLNGASSRVADVLGGTLTVVLTGTLAVLAAVALERLVFDRFEYGWLAEALVASMLIAFRSLFDHVLAVARGLECNLQAGRSAVAHIVGRDPQQLDVAGVSRAAIESAAENFSDAVVVPLFWYVLLGLPGLFVYKTVNTLDSMIGHRTERYRDFGLLAARLDDVMNFVPARLAGCYFVAAALLVPGASAANSWRVMLRDAPKHRSPSAGWQEAAVAGALDIALAGPRTYPHEVVDDDWMGDGRATLDAGDIHRSLRLYLTAGALVALTLTALWLLD